MNKCYHLKKLKLALPILIVPLILPSVYGQGVPRIIGEIAVGALPKKGSSGFQAVEARLRAKAWRKAPPKLTFREVKAPSQKASTAPQVLVPKIKRKMPTGQATQEAVSRKGLFLALRHLCMTDLKRN